LVGSCRRTRFFPW